MKLKGGKMRSLLYSSDFDPLLLSLWLSTSKFTCILFSKIGPYLLYCRLQVNTGKSNWNKHLTKFIKKNLEKKSLFCWLCYTVLQKWDHASVEVAWCKWTYRPIPLPPFWSFAFPRPLSGELQQKKRPPMTSSQPKLYIPSDVNTQINSVPFCFRADWTVLQSSAILL